VDDSRRSQRWRRSVSRHRPTALSRVLPRRVWKGLAFCDAATRCAGIASWSHSWTSPHRRSGRPRTRGRVRALVVQPAATKSLWRRLRGRKIRQRLDVIQQEWPFGGWSPRPGREVRSASICWPTFVMDGDSGGLSAKPALRGSFAARKRRFGSSCSVSTDTTGMNQKAPGPLLEGGSK
jgi:hypothetical protein